MIAYRDPKMRFQAFLGRQYLYQNNKVLHFDGARVEARTPFGLGARVFAGWIVRPQFAPSIGYFMTGARVSHRRRSVHSRRGHAQRCPVSTQCADLTLWIAVQ